GERLLGDDVAAELHRPDDVLVVVRVLRGDDDSVGALLAHHPVEVRRGEGGAVHPDVLLRVLEPAGVNVAQSDELERVRVLADETTPPHRVAAHTGADERDAPQVGGTSWLREQRLRTGHRRRGDGAAAGREEAPTREKALRLTVRHANSWWVGRGKGTDRYRDRYTDGDAVVGDYVPTTNNIIRPPR